MSEQENKTSGGSGGPVVMVDKSASSRHKPYRPTELQDDTAPDLHKRSKAPAVPSVAEELKNITVSETSAPREIMESERTKSSEKHMPVAKNISSSGKRRGSSPEEIAMVSLDATKDNLSTLPQPIPAQVETVVSEVSSLDAPEKVDLEKRGDDDSITEEITELRTEAAVKEHSEWPATNSAIKKKEISWQDNQYLNKVQLQDVKAKSHAALLERKASVGPCYRHDILNGGPSGIAICVPKKSVRVMRADCDPMPSVININVSKKSVSKSTSHLGQSSNKLPKKKEEPGIKIGPDEHQNKFFSVFRTKLDNMTCKIRNLLNM